MKKQDDRTQCERFDQAARELVCDESEERFNEALKAVAKHKPKEAAKPAPASRRRGADSSG
jgi:hypothetical protein